MRLFFIFKMFEMCHIFVEMYRQKRLLFESTISLGPLGNELHINIKINNTI